MSETLQVKWDFEDELEMDMTEEMYIASRVVNGVRMYPYVKINGEKYYLERYV